MGRSWRFVVAWLTAASAAVTVSWLGVRVGIAPAITAEAPVAIDVNRRYTEVRFGPADPTVTPTAPRPKPSRSSARPARTPTAAPTPTRTPSVRPPTASPSASPSQTEPDRRPRYRVPADGGDVIVAYSSTRVDVIDTEPRLGYVASASRSSDTVVVVRLEGPAHASVVTAYWDDGPEAQIVEEYR
ncbi:hypothetical protein [Couchioplanes azureus]|uniref:hypothetical protein n=1 Tax=Couchioplanes caeruleus TaxID=56438 RepID=UPI00166FCDDD|nr:hypothetical protein [Couchioplanes caeruleus]GGQ80730.1 hypothetical protein GCM10010166_58510 [Couchioplanes caeruleus subsp. azureus]